jgi:hypothetical protein
MLGPLRIIPGISLGSALMETGSASRSGGSVYTNTHSATVDGVNQSLGGIAANSLLTRALATTPDEATIAFWIKIANTTSDNYIYGKAANANNYMELKLGSGTSGQVSFTCIVGGAFAVYQLYTSPFTTGVWHHVAMVFRVGVDTYWDAELHVDGTQLGWTFGFSATNTSIDPGGKFNFAKAPLSSTFSELEFDEIACWDRALDSGEIQELAGAGVDVHGNLLVNGSTYASANGLVAWYKLNNNLTDSMGGANLSAPNGVTYTTDIPFT